LPEKGGYSGVEDYRWAVISVRQCSRVQFPTSFNLFFIVLYQKRPAGIDRSSRLERLPESLDVIWPRLIFC